MTELRLLIAIIPVMICTISIVAIAEDGPVPLIPRGIGEQCVEDVDFMRRNHMELLKRQRDETTRKGVRNTKYSLQGCIACHVMLGTDGKAVTITSEKHFCNSCHAYTAVKIDCFMCHTSTPSQNSSPPGEQQSGKGVK